MIIVLTYFLLNTGIYIEMNVMKLRLSKSIFLPFLLFVLAFSCSSQKELCLMTFNIRYGTAADGENRWELRQPILMQVLHRYQPQILGLQEALPMQVEAIQKQFPEWQWFGKGRYHGIEISSRPHESGSGESCVIFYDANRFELLAENTFWHSDYPDSAGSITWGNGLPRVTTWGLFRRKQDDKKFVVMNTHYHWDEPYVENTSRLMMRKWREIAGDLPTVIMGDFNLPPTSWTHALFCGEQGPEDLRGRFIDCWQALRKPEENAGTAHGFTGAGKQRIDWILVTPEFAIKETEIIYHHINYRYPSDHFPVLARVQL